MGDAPIIIRRPRLSPHNEIEQMIIKLLTGMSHGKVTMVIQDGVVIQMNREESVRVSPVAAIEN